MTQVLSLVNIWKIFDPRWHNNPVRLDTKVNSTPKNYFSVCCLFISISKITQLLCNSTILFIFCSFRIILIFISARTIFHSSKLFFVVQTTSLLLLIPIYEISYMYYFVCVRMYGCICEIHFVSFKISSGISSVSQIS